MASRLIIVCLAVQCTALEYTASGGRGACCNVTLPRVGSKGWVERVSFSPPPPLAGPPPVWGHSG